MGSINPSRHVKTALAIKENRSCLAMKVSGNAIRFIFIFELLDLKPKHYNKIKGKIPSISESKIAV